VWAVEAVTRGIQGKAKGRPFLQEPEAIGEEHMFKTVLWATDGSAAAERALPVATSVAQTYGAKLIVIHAGVQVSEIPLAAPAAVAAAQESADATDEAMRRKVEDLKRDGVSVEFASTEITTGGPAYAIAGFAHDTGADLIVVGTSGSSQLVRLLVGSVTRRLLELAPCPVLAVPPED
jgi:nucleotide-binding universal stress UspA family protein